MKPTTVQAWQLATYEAVLTAYQRALANYNEQVAAAQVQARDKTLSGATRKSSENKEATELKKASLRMLTDEYARTRVGGNWRFNELFNAMKPTGAFGYPEFDVNEALVEGQIIQFFEQAFEWNNLTYRFYPYFWGRKENWRTSALIDDTDPQFADFLRAGAARVVIPVHPAYVEAMLHYLPHPSEVWNGDLPPTVDDPLLHLHRRRDPSRHRSRYRGRSATSLRRSRIPVRRERLGGGGSPPSLVFPDPDWNPAGAPELLDIDPVTGRTGNLGSRNANPTSPTSSSWKGRTVPGNRITSRTMSSSLS